MDKIKGLKTQFNGKGDTKGETFTQLEKNNEYALYKRTNDEDGAIICYEIFKRKISDIPPKWKDAPQWAQYDKMEVYPSNEHFGIWAWCCRTLESVEKIKKMHFNN